MDTRKSQQGKPMKKISTKTKQMEDQEGVALDSGQARLEALGYKQELSRRLGLCSSVASSFATMAYMMGITGSLPIALVNGGPASAVWGWVICSVLNLLSALSLAEIASSYPIAGGPYFWCLELTNNDPKLTLIAWCTGWSNLVGQFLSTGGAGYLTAVHVGQMWNLGNGHQFSQFEVFLAYAICLLAAGVLSSVSTAGVRHIILFATAWMIVGGVFLMLLLPTLAPTHQSASFVFLEFTGDSKDALGIPNDIYLFLLGMLMGQFSYIGYEAPAQFAEETLRADRVIGRGIVLSIVISSILGLGFLLCLLFCIQEPNELFTGEANGYFVAQIFYDILESRYGNVTAAIVLLGIPLVAIFNTVVMCLITASRMLWSFARDGGVPLYRVWAAVNKRTGTPLNATWAICAMGFLLGLPMLWSNAAFLAMGSITAVGLNLSYAVPIVLRLIFSKNFTSGPFKLGRAQPLINIIAILWLSFSVACFMLPPIYPINVTTLNWTPMVLGLVLTVVLVAWYLPRCGARYWYHGKAHTLDDENVRGGGRYNGPKLGVGSPTSSRLTLLDLMEVEGVKPIERGSVAMEMSRSEKLLCPKAARPARPGQLPVQLRSSYAHLIWPRQDLPMLPGGIPSPFSAVSTPSNSSAPN